jgi:hypothetical protein
MHRSTLLALGLLHFLLAILPLLLVGFTVRPPGIPCPADSARAPDLSRPSPICRYNHSELIGSSPRDAVFFYASHPGPGLRLSIKSLRSSGCLCRIILFVPPDFDPRDDAAFFAQFAVSIIAHGADPQRALVPHMTRYESELRWLEENAGTVDRVLHSDAFDVFFQGDPFTEHVMSDSLTFVVEPHCIRSCGWNLGWIHRCYGDKGASEMEHKFIICSGSIGGPAQDYAKLVRLMVEQPEWTSCWGASLDQPILNYVVWSGVARRAGIRYRFTGCDDGFFTMQWCVLEANVLTNDAQQVVSVEGTVPSYLHQYDRNPHLKQDLFERCDIG